MHDPARGWSLSFAGCGFLGFYHLGVTRCLSERAPHLLRDARTFFGASAGALHCVSFLAGVPLDQVIRVFFDLVRSARRRNIGVLHPSFNMSRRIRQGLRRHLPANIHQLISGKVFISLTRVSDRENILVSDFQSKDEVVDALVCSSFIPLLSGLIPPAFRGVRYVDGGMTNNVPFLDAKTTIIVSPFYGEYDICPKVTSTNFLHVDISKLSLRLCAENAYLFSCVMWPPDLKVLGELCFQGYIDAVRFLEENGISTGLRLHLDLCPREPDVLAPRRGSASLEASPGGAAWPTRPEGDQLLGPLRLGTLPWDQGLLERLSPKLALALSEAFENQGRRMSKICSFLPVKVMSYVMLPWTLPVESAIAVVWRLVMWLPDVSEDVQWLQWVTSQVCCRVMKHLLPTSRSHSPHPHAPQDTAAFRTLRPDS